MKMEDITVVDGGKECCENGCFCLKFEVEVTADGGKCNYSLQTHRHSNHFKLEMDVRVNR